MTRYAIQLVMFILCICAIGCDHVRPVATPNAPTTTSAAEEQPQPATEDRTDAEPLTIADLNERQVIGLLGVPFGTVVEIKATVVAGDDLRRKQYQSAYLLRVTEVDGRALELPPVMTFFVWGPARGRLAANNSELHEMKTGAKARTFTREQIDTLQQGYVGQQMRLMVYEIGRFAGIPKELPNDVMSWTDVGFGFSTSLYVLAER